VLGKLSGRHAFVDKLAALGYQLPDAQLEEAFQRFKALADKKKQVFDDDLIALIDDEIAQANHRLKFVSLTVACGSFGRHGRNWWWRWMAEPSIILQPAMRTSMRSLTLSAPATA
jgi:isopropylmalate/homocitrate/citramalate synthase